jgi:hypothetical protein
MSIVSGVAPQWCRDGGDGYGGYGYGGYGYGDGYGALKDIVTSQGVGQ